MRRSLLLLLALFSILIACNKTPDPQLDVITMLRTGKWHITSGTVTMRGPNGVKAAQTYYPNLRKQYLRDDEIRFDSSGYAFVYNNSKRSDVGDPDSVGFNYVIKNNDANFDFFNAYKIIDSVAQVIYPDAAGPNGYSARYDTAVSHVKDIRNGKLSNVSETSFTIEYSLIGQYNDTTLTHWTTPILRPDTFIFNVTYGH
ncbi:hypothetical protein [Flavipsychrobacter stenotrophus]|nr:hypothetical protein [Flavipsychrobacter stenotrophus]